MVERTRQWVLALTALVCAAVAIGLWMLVLSGRDPNSKRELDTAVAATQGGSPEAGYHLIELNGCAACHEILGIPGPEGKVGPSLKGLKDRQFIAGVLANSPDNLTRWIENPRAIDPKTAMPVLGLTHKQAQDVAAYLYAPSE